MFFLKYQKSYKLFFLSMLLMSVWILHKAYAETVSGGGYILEQIVSPINGTVSGNGYISNQVGQVEGNLISGGGYKMQGVFGKSSTPTEPAPIVTPFSSGGGYFMIPSVTTSTTSGMTNPDGTAIISPKVNGNTVLTTNGSTCTTRVALTSAIDLGLKNDPIDVKKLQLFLNTYEGANLKVDGFYGKDDYAAVKKWQEKYRANILDPMRLKNPTGTVYTSSMRQIERQTTIACGQQIIVHACPYFKMYMMFGDSGAEVKKIQQFLNIVQGEKLPINGKYGPVTIAAVKRFQRVYKKDIISFITFSFITGNWNISTRIKANEIIGCDKIK